MDHLPWKGGTVQHNPVYSPVGLVSATMQCQPSTGDTGFCRHKVVDIERTRDSQGFGVDSLVLVKNTARGRRLFNQGFEVVFNMWRHEYWPLTS